MGARLQSKGTYYEKGLMEFLRKQKTGGVFLVDVQFNKETHSSKVAPTITSRFDRAWKNWLVIIE